MLHSSRIEQFYKDVRGLGIKFPVATISKATGYSTGNVSEYLSRKKEPSESFLNAFYDWCRRNDSAVEEPQTEIGGFKDKYIASLERENSRLQKDLEVSLGEVRHVLLLTRAISETNQQLLIEILMKQRKQTFEMIALEVGKVNGENYTKAKAESRFDDVGR